jgi:hypothetical protein
VRFWDTSAVVPLLVTEGMTEVMAGELAVDAEQTVWWATSVECASALARLERSGSLDERGLAEANVALGTLADAWDEVQPGERVRQVAARVVRVHDLRSLDAFQLAAALVAADGDPGSLPFVVLDRRLGRAADREGFPVVIPHTGVG